MITETAAHRLLLRSHRRSGRVVVASVLTVLLVALLVAVVVAVIWSSVDPAAGSALGQRLRDGWTDIRTSWWFTVVGIVALMVGAWLLVLAVLPGRRHRRVRMTERAALVVDDTVLADAIAENVARACVLDRRQVSAVVGRRSASVSLIPTSGVPVDRDTAQLAASDLLQELGFALRVQIQVRRDGVIA